jgi:hypothetical protein
VNGAPAPTPVSFTIPPSISQWFPWLAGGPAQAFQFFQQSVNQAAQNVQKGISTPGAIAAQPTQGAEASSTAPPTDWTIPALVLGGAAVIGIGYYIFEVEK